jgi:transcriptional regulator of nitric oxide reductase
MAFDGSGFIRGTAFDGSDLIRGMALATFSLQKG